MKRSKLSLIGHAPFLAFLLFSLASTLALSTTSSSLTPKERLYVFKKVWKTVQKHYYDPAFGGVNWPQVHRSYLPLVQAIKDDKEFYALMDRMTAELHDLHTDFYSPQQWKDINKRQAMSLGFLAGYIEEKVVVLDVIADSNAARAGVMPGMVVRAVNGRPIEAALKEEAKKVLRSSSERVTRLLILEAIFASSPERPVHLSMERADGSILEAKFARQELSYAPEVTSAKLLSGFGYIRFDGFQNNLVNDFKSALEHFRQTPGVILDLRWNGGGDGVALDAMAESFLNQKTLFANLISRKQFSTFERDGRHTEETEMFTGRSGGQIYAGPLVILISAYSRSMAEVFAAGMQDSGRATIVGSQSCGCALGIVNNRVMKGGGVLQISEMLFLSPKGRRLEGEGVIPDVAAAPTIASLRENRDVVLEAGEKTLREFGAAKYFYGRQLTPVGEFASRH